MVEEDVIYWNRVHLRQSDEMCDWRLTFDIVTVDVDVVEP